MNTKTTKFALSEGVKTTIEVVNGELVVTTQESIRFNEGDYLCITSSFGEKYPVIYQGENIQHFCSFFHIGLRLPKKIGTVGFNRGDVLEYATPEECKQLDEALAKEGKFYNQETKQLEELEVFPRVIRYCKTGQIVLVLSRDSKFYNGVSLSGVNGGYYSGHISETYSTGDVQTTLSSDTKITLTVEQLLAYSMSLINNAEKLR